MAVDPKFDAVRNYLQAQVGAPIVEPVEGEISAIQTAINLALVSWWSAFPYTWRDSQASPIRGGLSFTADQILERVFPDPKIRKLAYFLGIARIESSPSLVIGSVDNYLLGAPIFNTQGGLDPMYGGGAYDYRKDLLQATELDMTTGEVEVEFGAGGEINLITPQAWAQFQIWFAFGFTEASSLKFVKNSQLDLFRKMAAVEFLTIVLNARGQINVNSDYTLNLNIMQSRRDFLQAQVTQEVSNQIQYPMTWG